MMKINPVFADEHLFHKFIHTIIESEAKADDYRKKLLANYSALHQLFQSLLE